MKNEAGQQTMERGCWNLPVQIDTKTLYINEIQNLRQKIQNLSNEMSLFLSGRYLHFVDGLMSFGISFHRVGAMTTYTLILANLFLLSNGTSNYFDRYPHILILVGWFGEGV